MIEIVKAKGVGVEVVIFELEGFERRVLDGVGFGMGGN